MLALKVACYDSEPKPKISNLRVTEGRVLVLLRSIRANSATGPDSIPARVLRECAVSLSPSLTRLFNASIVLGKSPDAWKMGLILPLFKAGDKANLDNYRPISITSLLGKVLERLVYQCLLDHVQTAGLIPSNQHGFLPRRSCTTMLTAAFDEWLTLLDQNQGTHIHAVFLDWCKAFDKVPHKRLISKLSYLGIDGNVLAWISDFLSDRKQQVLYRGSTSHP